MSRKACEAYLKGYSRRYSGYSSYESSSHPSYTSSSNSSGVSGKSASPRWSRSGSSVSYTSAQIQSFTPIREAIERRAAVQPDLRDALPLRLRALPCPAAFTQAISCLKVI